MPHIADGNPFIWLSFLLSFSRVILAHISVGFSSLHFNPVSCFVACVNKNSFSFAAFFFVFALADFTAREKRPNRGKFDLQLGVFGPSQNCGFSSHFRSRGEVDWKYSRTAHPRVWRMLFISCTPGLLTAIFPFREAFRSPLLSPELYKVSFKLHLRMKNAFIIKAPLFIFITLNLGGQVKEINKTKWMIKAKEHETVRLTLFQGFANAFASRLPHSSSPPRARKFTLYPQLISIEIYKQE